MVKVVRYMMFKVDQLIAFLAQATMVYNLMRLLLKYYILRHLKKGFKQTGLLGISERTIQEKIVSFNLTAKIEGMVNWMLSFCM